MPVSSVTSTVWDPWFLMSSAPSNLSNIQKTRYLNEKVSLGNPEYKRKARVMEANWILGIWLAARLPWMGSSGWVRIVRRGLKERDMIMECKGSHDKWGKRQHKGTGKRNPPINSAPPLCRAVLNAWEDKINLEQVSLLHYSLISSSANGDSCRVLFRTRFMNVYKVFRIVPGTYHILNQYKLSLLLFFEELEVQWRWQHVIL